MSNVGNCRRTLHLNILLRHVHILPILHLSLSLFLILTLTLTLRQLLPALRDRSPIRLLDDHDLGPLEGIPLGGVDAGADKEDEVDEEDEAGGDGDGGEDGPLAALGLGAEVVLVGVAVVALRFVVVHAQRGRGALRAADDGGEHPGQQRDADVRARVDAVVVGAAQPARCQFGDGPEEGDDELCHVVSFAGR